MRILLALLFLSSTLPAQDTRPADEEGSVDESSSILDFPKVHYGASRSSDTWVGVEGGARVAIGEGIKWKGVRYYLSLTYDLVAVPDGAEHASYVKNISAFWDTLGIEVVEVSPGKNRDLVALRSTRRGQGDHVEYRDLATGDVVEVAGQEVDLGQVLETRLLATGADGPSAKKFLHLVASEKAWNVVAANVLPESARQLEGVDFDTHVVLVYALGDTWNTRSVRIESAHENDERVLVRLGIATYQTIGGGNRVRVYGAFVLPRCDKPYVFERNRQGLIGGPELWKEDERLEIESDPASELKAIQAQL